MLEAVSCQDGGAVGWDWKKLTRSVLLDEGEFFAHFVGIWVSELGRSSFDEVEYVWL